MSSLRRGKKARGGRGCRSAGRSLCKPVRNGGRPKLQSLARFQFGGATRLLPQVVGDVLAGREASTTGRHRRFHLRACALDGHLSGLQIETYAVHEPTAIERPRR